jgi:probable F420-dependent oxidoreductase
MKIELGEYGVWQRASDVTPAGAVEVERMGYGALWMGGSPGGDLAGVEAVLDATESIPVATGIVNMWRDDAETVAGSYHRISHRHPNRFLLGVGIGHPESTSEYDSPYETMVAYLDRLDAADVPKEHLALAALGPRALRLAAERTAGSHPYFTTPRHTRFARDLVGDDVLLAPEQTVVIGNDAVQLAGLARSFATRYLSLVNYRNSLLREGWAESDLDAGGSDRLLEEVVVTGDATSIAGAIQSHISAGADHVCIQVLGPQPLSGLRALADELGL